MLMISPEKSCIKDVSVKEAERLKEHGFTPYHELKEQNSINNTSESSAAKPKKEIKKPKKAVKKK